ncbi:MAG: hypothetical protein AAFP76_02755 [Bacteroidota bacterium]
MAPIKFEENIREKLQERELQPQTDSWNKLAASLEEEMPKRNRRRMWMAVAAGLIGILLAVTMLFGPKEEVLTDQLVEDTTEDTLKETPLEEVRTSNDVVKQEAVQELGEIEATEDLKTSEEIIDPVVKNVNQQSIAEVENTSLTKEGPVAVKKDMPVIIETEMNEVVAINNQEKSEDVIESPVNNKEELFIENKIDAVVANIQQIQKENNVVTVEEIDALLAKAQRDIATNRILNSGSNKVDATALLQDVESELERSFRDRVFEALGDGFNKVRTAVVERNN